jgi:hypothetical protein
MPAAHSRYSVFATFGRKITARLVRRRSSHQAIPVTTVTVCLSPSRRISQSCPETGHDSGSHSLPERKAPTSMAERRSAVAPTFNPRVSTWVQARNANAHKVLIGTIELSVTYKKYVQVDGRG